LKGREKVKEIMRVEAAYIDELMKETIIEGREKTI
jgi:hypothetical protein